MPESRGTPLPGWIAAQRFASAKVMREACSATGLTRHREGFGWSLRPAPGSVLASVRMTSWDPEPDYFHHWIRDSAIVLRAVPLAVAAEPDQRDFWLGFIADFVTFSLRISDPERRGPKQNPLRATTKPDHLPYLRPDSELSALSGADWQGEPRVAADGSPDLERWSRPQDDGPALRASALIAVLEALPEARSADAEALIARDLAHLLTIRGRPSIGPWEEEPPRRASFTLIAAWDALDHGAARGAAEAPEMEAAAAELLTLIAEAEDGPTGGWRESIEAAPGRLDAATCLAVLHARRRDGPLAITAPRLRATAAALEAAFAAEYPINRDRQAIGIGRWVGDVYFEGNPWYPTTLGFAALHYLIAAKTGDARAFAKAEGWMALIEEFAPKPAGPLPEQFDRASGAPRSSLNLTWSAAGFLEAAEARDLALETLTGQDRPPPNRAR